MTATIEQYETIITEYKEFRIDTYGEELTNTFNEEVRSLVDKQAANKNENAQKIDGYEQLHNEHKALQNENNAAHEGRKRTLDDINGLNNDYSKFANQAVKEHDDLRGKIAGLEHPLRGLQNEVTNLNLDNKNLQQVIDTEVALRNAKAQAELSAVTTVHGDLKNQTERIEKDIDEERSKKSEAQRILDELNGKFYFELSLSW